MGGIFCYDGKKFFPKTTGSCNFSSIHIMSRKHFGIETAGKRPRLENSLIYG